MTVICGSLAKFPYFVRVAPDLFRQFFECHFSCLQSSLRTKAVAIHHAKTPMTPTIVASLAQNGVMVFHALWIPIETQIVKVAHSITALNLITGFIFSFHLILIAPRAMPIHAHVQAIKKRTPRKFQADLKINSKTATIIFSPPFLAFPALQRAFAGLRYAHDAQ